MRVIHRTSLDGRVDFSFALGNLFDADVEAIVNSENSAFELAWSPGTISGQMRQRFGDALQDELRALTGGQTFRAGTILETDGYGEFKRIFHAGFHDPADWPDLPGSSSEADYFEAIRACISQILDRCVTTGTRSVAFPLLGCGSFGLDERMLVMQFVDELGRFAERAPEGEPLEVILVVFESQQFEATFAALLEMVLQHHRQTLSVSLPSTGVGLLDDYSARFSDLATEEWVKWQLCRYSEVALQIMAYAVFRAESTLNAPEALFQEGMPASFGTIRQYAVDKAGCILEAKQSHQAWGCLFFAELLSDRDAGRALQSLNAQRNNLAHGRQSLPIDQIRMLMEEGLGLQRWTQVTQSDGEPEIHEWGPWASRPSRDREEVGLFERWQKKARRYLVPDSGEIFSLPRNDSPT